MKMHDLYPERKTVALLIPPMLFSANDVRSLVANRIKSDVRLLIPDLSAHGEDAASTYRSARAEAKAIHDYLAGHQVCDLQLAFGASLGGVVLLELLRYPDVRPRHALFEGTSFFEHAPFYERVIRQVFLSKHRKAMRDPAAVVREMTKLYGHNIGAPTADALRVMGEESIRNIVHDCGNVDLPPLAEDIQKRCVFAYGERDGNCRTARRVQPRRYPRATLKVWEGFGHCERIIRDADGYVRMIEQLLTD